MGGERTVAIAVSTIVERKQWFCGHSIDADQAFLTSVCKTCIKVRINSDGISKRRSLSERLLLIPFLLGSGVDRGGSALAEVGLHQVEVHYADRGVPVEVGPGVVA